MISNAYEKADFQIVEFALEDVLTASEVIHTTTEVLTTLPQTTLPPVTVPETDTASTTVKGSIGGGSGDASADFSDFFQ